MAILLDIQSESTQDIRGFPVSSGTGGIMRVRNASCVDHTVVHYFYDHETTANNTVKQLWAYGNGTADGAYGIVTVFNTTGPSFVVRLRQTDNAGGSVANALDVTCSPAFPSRGALYMVSVTASVVASTSATYTVRVYRDGVLIGSGTSGTRTATMTLPTVFSFTADNVVASRGGFQNARGIHTHWLMTGIRSNAELDALALLPFVGPHINHASTVVYSPATYTVEGTTAGAGVRPETIITTTNTCTIDVNAASNPTSLLVSRTIATLTGTVRWVDPFLESGLAAPAPATSLSGAPVGWTVGNSFLAARSSQLRALAAAWASDAATVRQRIALLANSRCSIDVSARVTPRDGSVTFNGRNWSGNYVDYDFCVEMAPIIRGRHNFQPPLSGDTYKAAWGFDCELNNPLTTGTACVSLADTSAARFGTGSRVAAGSNPTYQGPGDPIRVPTSASYRLLARNESGLLASDAIQTDVYILNYPNSSDATVIKEAAQHTQDGAALSLGYSAETVPTLGTTMTAATFSGYSTSTNIFSGLNTVADAQVGDMLEVCDSSGNTITDVELAVITAIGADTITVDGKFKIGATIAGTPANYRLKWCAPGIHKISATHAASQTNANWRGLKITAGGTRGGLILLGFGVSNVTRPGPEIMPIGWSGRGWTDQYTQMSHIVSARDGKTMSQRLFETLAPDLVMFSVADQGNPTVAQFPTYAATYVDYILRGTPNAEIVMAGDCAHSALETVVGLTDAAQSYSNHHAAMRELAITRGYPYLTLIGDSDNQRAGLGNVCALYARGVLLDGTAHPFRGIWGGWMSVVNKIVATSYAAESRSRAVSTRVS